MQVPAVPAVRSGQESSRHIPGKTEGEQMICGKAGIDVAQVLDGAHEEAGADNEQQAEADLQRHAGAAKLQRSPGAGASLLFEGLRETRIPVLQGRRQTEEQAGDERCGNGEDQNAPIEGGRKGRVLIPAGHPGNEDAKGTRGDDETKSCTRQTEQ